MVRLLRLFTLFLVFCGNVRAEKILRYSEDGAPTNMDPVQSNNIYSNKITTAVYDRLFEYRYLKRPYELKPNLAVDFPEVSKDGLTYTFKIKKGVHFIDDPCFEGGKGRELTAHDFVYSIKRHFDPKNMAQGAWLWEGKIKGLDVWKKKGADYNKEAEGLKAVDDYTIQIVLEKPFPQLLYTLEMGFAGIVPKEAVDKYGKELSIHPVGSGPFKLVSHNSKQTVLVRNPNYRKEIFDVKDHGYDEKIHGFTGIKSLDGKTLPIVDRVEVNWFAALIPRWISFRKSNEVVWTVLQNEQMDEVLESKNPVKLKKEFSDKYHHRVQTESGYVFMDFNMDDPEIGYNKDPKRQERNKGLRCAIRKAFDWRQRIDRFYLGLGSPFPGVIVPGSDGYNKDLDKSSVTLDIEGAKKLLKDHGWTAANLPVLEYSGVASVRDKQFYEQFRGWLGDIGYPKNKIKLKNFATFGDFSKAQKHRQLMLIPMGWGLDYPDAENTLGLFYGPNQSPGSNHSNYVNPEFDKLFDQAKVMLPSKERTELYDKLNRIVIDDCVSVSGFARTRVFMWHKNAIMWPERNIVSNVFKWADIN